MIARHREEFGPIGWEGSSLDLADRRIIRRGADRAGIRFGCDAV